MAVGEYTLQVTHGLTASDEQIPVYPNQSIDISVTGPRFVLPAEDIHAVFPPANSTGLFLSDLPHIVFNKSVIPWEIPIKNAPENTPWLALLVFDEEELKNDPPVQSINITPTSAFTAKMGELFPKKLISDDIFRPAIDIKENERNLSCNAIIIKRELLNSVELAKKYRTKSE